MNRLVGCLTVLVLLVAMPAWAYDGIVEKKTFAMPAYTTVGGTTIKGVRVGYETYGTLNAGRDNVILVAHFYSGNSHAAGKYAASDPAPGYWDAIIGSGKPADTDRFFVVSSDTLVNLNVKDPKTITTGPASINSDTGRPYGMSFPIVTIRDFVNVQKALLDSLGIKKLHAVMGASMGALQSFEWAAAYPDMVERIVPVIGAAELNAFGIGWLGVWAAPIMLDPRWNKGDYYGQEEPVEGLALALKIVTLHARHYGGVGRIRTEVGGGGAGSGEELGQQVRDRGHAGQDRPRAGPSLGRELVPLPRQGEPALRHGREGVPGGGLAGRQGEGAPRAREVGPPALPRLLQAGDGDSQTAREPGAVLRD